MSTIRLYSILIAFVLAPLFSASGATQIWVNGGGFVAPYYGFYSDSGLTQPLDLFSGGADSLVIGQDYIFTKNATTHPFYMSDQGYAQTSSSVISLEGAGSAASGIGGGQSFTLSFNGFDPNVDTLTYYCTAHSSMVGTLQVIPEPGTYALFGGALALILVGLRRRFRG